MIEVKNLNKSFDGFCALKNLDMTVPTGSVYGLIGVNGSGKTTIIRQLAGVMRPDSGTIKYDGEDVFDNMNVKEKLGYIPDELFFYPSYSIDDMAGFYKRMYKNWDRNRFEQMIISFGLNEKARCAKLSKGMQKQAAFSLVLAAKPEYLILDEPVDGLDPLVRTKLWNFIVEDVADRNMTVLISSHNLDEMENICDSIGILEKGEMKLEGDLDMLREQMKPMSLREIFLKEMGGEQLEK